MSDSRYAEQKFSLAILALTLGPGDIKARLVEAYGHFHAVSRDDLPEGLRGTFDRLISTLTRKAPLVAQHSATQISGSVEQTLHFMRRKSCVRLAEEILKLRDELRAHNSSGR